MEEISAKAKQLNIDITQAAQRLNIKALRLRLDELTHASQQPGFWDDSTAAQITMQDMSKLESRVSPWTKLMLNINDLCEMIDLGDKSIKSELDQQLQAIAKEFNGLKETLKLNGPYDDHNAIVSIYAGAGGTDAQDWTQMLFRMYSRFFEINRWKASMVDESPGEEAGLKSVTIQVDGEFAYGKLKSEHGVHRLVRLSPFNSDNLRQTSFAKVEVMPKISRPEEVEIDQKDLKVDVYRSGGHGGQSVNTTDSAVRVTHTPTGMTVAIQNERSQLQNKETAMTILRSKLAQLQMEQHVQKVGQLKGPNQSAEWGNQIRTYVLHPYKQVKDLRTKYETSDPQSVLDGALQPFIDAYLERSIK